MIIIMVLKNIRPYAGISVYLVVLERVTIHPVRTISRKDLSTDGNPQRLIRRNPKVDKIESDLCSDAESRQLKRTSYRL